MRFTYYMQVQPWNLTNSQYKPMVFDNILSPSEGSKIFTIHVEIPDDTFGPIVQAVVEQNNPEPPK